MTRLPHHDAPDASPAPSSFDAAEARYRALAHAVGQIAWRTAPDGTVADADVADWCAFTGMSPAEGRGLGWMDAVHPDDRRAMAEAWQRAVAARGPYDAHYRIRGADGLYRRFHARGVPVVRADGGVDEWVGVCVDVTEQFEADQALRALNAELDARNDLLRQQASELRAMNRELLVRTGEATAARREAEDANRAKSDFLAVMSHELRTPLNSIAGYAQLMQMGVPEPVPAAHQAYLERIQQSQRHLLGLINSVLNYARVEAGRVSYTIRPTPVTDLLTAVHALVATQVAEQRLSYACEPCPDDLHVLADGDKVTQVLLNLVSNSVKFTPRGGRVWLSAGPSDAHHVAIRVCDTGIGIPADKLATVFEPFVQVAPALTRTSEGTGLGLAISRDLAHGMGGTLQAESVEGEGSCFTLTLPRASPA